MAGPTPVRFCALFRGQERHFPFPSATEDKMGAREPGPAPRVQSRFGMRGLGHAVRELHCHWQVVSENVDP